MRRLAMMAFCFTVIFAVGCGSKPKDQIIGKWELTEPKEMKDMGVVVEFKQDGTTTTGMKVMGVDASISGKYKFTADDVVEIEMEMPAMPGSKETKKETKKMKVEVTKDSLTTTELDGKKDVSKFKKKT